MGKNVNLEELPRETLGNDDLWVEEGGVTTEVGGVCYGGQNGDVGGDGGCDTTLRRGDHVVWNKMDDNDRR